MEVTTFKSSNAARGNLFKYYIRNLDTLFNYRNRPLLHLTARDPGSVVTEAAHWVEHAGGLAAEEAGGAVTEARVEQGAVGGVSQPVVIPKPQIEASAWTRELILVKCGAASSVIKCTL